MLVQGDIRENKGILTVSAGIDLEELNSSALEALFPDLVLNLEGEQGEVGKSVGRG